jgi:hypothetical protein
MTPLFEFLGVDHYLGLSCNKNASPDLLKRDLGKAAQLAAM